MSTTNILPLTHTLPRPSKGHSMPFTNKLSRATIKKTSKKPWGLIPETQIHSAIVTNGSLAVEVIPFQAQQFALTQGKDLIELPEQAHKVLPRTLSHAKELCSTCILSDEANRISRLYIDTHSKAYFFDVLLLTMIDTPEVLWTVDGNGPAIDDANKPTLWLMQVRTPRAETILDR